MKSGVCYVQRWNWDVVSLAQHKDCKQGEMASLALFKNTIQISCSILKPVYASMIVLKCNAGYCCLFMQFARVDGVW